MKTFTKPLFTCLLLLISVSAYTQSCKGFEVKYKLDTVKTSPNWSVVYLQLPAGAHLDSIYGGFQRPGYTGTALSFACYSIGTTNDTNLLNPASNYYYPYTGPYNQWIAMGAHNVIGKSNSYIQLSITTADGMVMDSVMVAYSCASSCSGIAEKYALDSVSSGSTWSWVDLTLPDGAKLDSIFGGFARPGYTGSSLSYSAWSYGATNNVSLLNTTTNTFNPYTGPYDTWINTTSYNIVGQTGSYVRFSITTTAGMTMDSAMIAYTCSNVTSTPEIEPTNGNISIYPNPTTTFLNINTNGQKFNQISITDLMGRVLFNSIFTDHIDISSLSSGIYIITINDLSGNIERQKFMKQ
ncbi:MAG: T9SS type A sorting domain-containing protein [Bacteroidia bacterium]